jgi:hypothetical protein
MKKFIVFIPEVHYQAVEIEAKDEAEARKKVTEGDGYYLDNRLEYSHTLNGDDHVDYSWENWKVEDAE